MKVGLDVVDVADVMLRFECSECGAAVTVPVGKGYALRQARRITEDMTGCNFCRTAWGFVIGTEEQKALLGFAETLERIVEIMKRGSQEKPVNLKLRLEVASSEKADPGR